MTALESLQDINGEIHYARFNSPNTVIRNPKS